MPISVSATTVRASGRSLKNAITAFKSARKRAIKTCDAYDNDEAHCRRTELEDELADTARVIRHARGQGLDHINLLELVGSAEKLIRDDLRRQASPRQTPVAPASGNVCLIDLNPPLSTAGERVAGNDARVADAAVANDTARNTRVLSPVIQIREPPSTAVLSTSGSLHSWEDTPASHRSSRDDILSQYEQESLLIDEEEEAFSLSSEKAAVHRQQAALQLQLEDIEARQKEQAKRRQFQERRRQNNASLDDAMSQLLLHSDQESIRSSRTRLSVRDMQVDQPMQPIQRAPTPPATPQQMAPPTLAPSIGQLTLPALQRHVQRSPTPIVSSPSCVRPTLVSTASHQNDVSPLSNSASAADLISATAAAAAAATAAATAAAMASGRPQGTTTSTSLDALKIAERRRPSEKFDGVSKEIDFEDHLRQFIRAVNLPGIAADEKLHELRHWFKGLALIQVGGFLRRQDADQAFTEAIERLKSEYGQRAETAEEMLSGVLKGEAIDKDDASAANEFICKVEGIYSLARETNRDKDFDRRSLFRLILMVKLPFLMEKWATYLCKREDPETKFSDFLHFLLLQKRISTELQESRDHIVKLGCHQPLMPTTSMEHLVSTNFGTSPVASPSHSVSPRRPRSGPKTPFCAYCRQDHWINDCPFFDVLETEEKEKFLSFNQRCHNCAGRHEIEECRFPGRCETCNRRHCTALHDVAAMRAAPLSPLSAAK